MARVDSARRRKGAIRQRGESLQVRYFAGYDPVTSKKIYLTATIPGTDQKAWDKADDKIAEFRTQVTKQQATESSVPLSRALDEWLRTSEIEDSTRKTYEGYITRTIKPALGMVAVKKLDARALESLYTELRRCRVRCDGKPFIEKHSTDADHDCVKAKCQPHVCKPMASSTVRQMHSIISGTMAAAQRWGWVQSNPATIAKRPRQKPPDPDPPSSAEAVVLVTEAFRMDPDWGTLVWLVMTTGIRRGELCGLRFSRLDLDGEVIDLRRNWVGGKEKDTKTHQSRRIALDGETVALLRKHRKRVAKRVRSLGQTFDDNRFVFSGTRTLDHLQPYSPNAVTQRYKDMATRLKIDTHLHALRHYSATELLTSGVDLRTVSGRLGHGGGGTTTLRVYAAWVPASDRKAAEVLASRMPKLPKASRK
ncbi:site-specific integrase [Pseudonocardia eucalypti]|uniref:Site-specific integrase n=1 Tax=Pseudonocardia eucalypti TaxID=648755 RepID=A0ABP9PZ28_9PSEU|nr:integrase [Pseudonocardia eucalypti]